MVAQILGAKIVMKNYLIAFSLAFLSILAGPLPSLHAEYVICDGKLVNKKDAPKYSAEKHYDLGCKDYNKGRYKDATYHFNVIVKNFPQESFYNDSQFFLGVCHFYDEEYDAANESFSEYIQCQNNPCYFEEAIGYKLQIAECFRMGAKKRFFGARGLPKWATARTLACEIYSEVISSMPCHEYAAFALWGKANLHWIDRDFKESVDAFQILIRRFPKHELAPEAYLCINQVYLDQARYEFQNPDLLVLAEINSRKFARAFPKDERLDESCQNVQAIREFYARGLFETGQFYERKEKPLASGIYYRSAIAQFPDTSYANCCRYRLSVIAPLCDFEGEEWDIDLNGACPCKCSKS